MGRGGRTGAAIGALALAASCVSPPPVDRSVASAPVGDPADARLLQGLALTVPAARDARLLPPPARVDVPPPFTLARADDDSAARAADCLSAAVYYEARSEPIDGQRAVAQVVLNRVRDRAFPASVCRVVYQRSSRGCQFSFACDGSTDRPVEPRAWATAAAVARAALAGDVYAPVGSATHYHTTAILPWWAPSLARIGVIGHHIFYRWATRLGEALSFRQAYSGREAPVTIAAAPVAPVVSRKAATEAPAIGHVAGAGRARWLRRPCAPWNAAGRRRGAGRRRRDRRLMRRRARNVVYGRLTLPALSRSDAARRATGRLAWGSLRRRCVS